MIFFFFLNDFFLSRSDLIKLNAVSHLTFLGRLDTLLCDHGWKHVCCNAIFPLSILTNIKRGGLSGLHRNCAQGALPAGDQHARICQKEEADQTGTPTPAGTAEPAKRTAANLALLFSPSLRSSHCRRGRLTLGRRSAGNTGVRALWEELLR